MLIPNLLTAATSVEATPPSTAAHVLAGALPYLCDQVTILVNSTAGSGDMDVTVQIYGYFKEADTWCSLKVLNGGEAIAETSANAIAYAEAIVGLRGVTALAARVTAINGTSTAVTVRALCIPASTQST